MWAMSWRYWTWRTINMTVSFQGIGWQCVLISVGLMICSVAIGSDGVFGSSLIWHCVLRPDILSDIFRCDKSISKPLEITPFWSYWKRQSSLKSFHMTVCFCWRYCMWLCVLKLKNKLSYPANSKQSKYGFPVGNNAFSSHWIWQYDNFCYIPVKN